MNSPHKGPFSIKLISWYGDHGPLQINVVCTHCNGTGFFQNLFEIQNFMRQDCPPFILNLTNAEGNVDLEILFSELEKRRQL